MEKFHNNDWKRVKNTCQSTCSRTASLTFPSAVSTSNATICDVWRDSVPFVQF